MEKAGEVGHPVTQGLICAQWEVLISSGLNPGAYLSTLWLEMGEAKKKKSKGGAAEASGGGFADNDSWPTGAKRLNEAMKDKACHKLDIAETRRKRGLRSGNTHTHTHIQRGGGL